ncbi:hypothetical protein BDN67DRAFT_91312 [Paxillus ammoniavirescens]|nr:hypothetical protein BDN67DRAFT_91312 [Paxillus ammoniavirescens]
MMNCLILAANPRFLVDDVPDAKRQRDGSWDCLARYHLQPGYWNRIFAGPSIILNSSGGIGITFVMWILGALVAAAGTAVYIEFGTCFPRSGGE